MPSGDLLVGFSSQKDLKIYSSEGVKIKTIKINKEKKAIPLKMKEELYKKAQDRAKRDPRIKNLIKNMKTLDIFPSFLPF